LVVCLNESVVQQKLSRVAEELHKFTFYEKIQYKMPANNLRLFAGKFLCKAFLKKAFLLMNFINQMTKMTL